MKIKFHFIFIFFAFMILGQMRVSVYSRDNRLTLKKASSVALTQAKRLLPGARLVSDHSFYGFQNQHAAHSLTFRAPDGRWLNMLISANQKHYPLVRYSYQKDPEMTKLEETKLLARKYIVNPQYVKTFYMGLGECWHLFISSKDSIYVNTWAGRKPQRPAVFREHQQKVAAELPNNVKSEDDSNIEDQWNALSRGTLLSPESYHYIPNRNDMPDFAWHYGCTPTAAADLLGYYDRVYGYGNMIKYFFREYDDIQQQYDETVPDVLKRLKDLMGTNDQGTTVDPLMGTHIAQAAEAQDEDYLATDHGMVGFGGEIGNIWNKLKEEVDADYPSILSCDLPCPAGGHSMAVVGYQEDPDYVATYNINDEGITNYCRNSLIFWNLVWVHFPLHSRQKGITLKTLRGSNKRQTPSEMVYTNQNLDIKWDCDRPGEGKIDIFINDNSGNLGSWERLVHLENNPGSWTWIPQSSHAGDDNRLQIIWYANDGSHEGYDASLSDFTVQEGYLPEYTDGRVGNPNFPDAIQLSYSNTQWAVVAVEQSNVTKENVLQLYPDTDFNSIAADDTLSKAAGRKWGLCGVNIGPNNPPPGPFGLQIVGEGEGTIQFVESKEIQWGTSSSYEYWSEDDIVAAYHFYIDPDDKGFHNNTKICLENLAQGDYKMILFDTSKRFFAYENAIKIADDAIEGADEELVVPSRSSGRFLLVIQNKNRKIGHYRLGLTNEPMAMELAELPWDTPTLLRYSGLKINVPSTDATWFLAGIIPHQNSEWQLDAYDGSSREPLIRSHWEWPSINMLIFNTQSAVLDCLSIVPTRKTNTGHAHFELVQINNGSPLTNGKNLSRNWPAGKAFQLFHISSTLPLRQLRTNVSANDGRKIFCGIVPDDEDVYSTSMIWGNTHSVPQTSIDAKTGVVVFWTQRIPKESFTYTFRTSAFTRVELPKTTNDTKDWALYPNPFRDHLVLSGTDFGHQKPQIQVFDILGRKHALAPGFTTKIESGQLRLDTKQLPSGTYIIRVKAETVKTFQVLKIK